MTILWLSWKDRGHPQAGGAEVVLHEVVRRQVADGHQVTVLTAAYEGAAAEDRMDGARILRVGRNRYTHNLQALWFYRRHLYNRFDMVLEVVNTAPYFAALLPGKARPVLLYHQMAGQVWQHETPWPVSWLGRYVLEPAATWLLSRSRAEVLSMSASTSADLTRYGFAPGRLHVITEGIHIEPLASLATVRKYTRPTLLSLGALRGMKRTLDQITAFEIMKTTLPTARLIVAGAPFGRYGQQVIAAIRTSPYAADITYEGPVSHVRKRQLMQRSHLILVSSVKEGWGLIVSEANSQGTPAVVYDADGLRDSVHHTKTGLVCAPTPAAMAAAALELLQKPKMYARTRQAAYRFSKTLNFDTTYTDMRTALKR